MKNNIENAPGGYLLFTVLKCQKTRPFNVSFVLSAMFTSFLVTTLR